MRLQIGIERGTPGDAKKSRPQVTRVFQSSSDQEYQFYRPRPLRELQNEETRAQIRGKCTFSPPASAEIVLEKVIYCNPPHPKARFPYDNNGMASNRNEIQLERTPYRRTTTHGYTYEQTRGFPVSYGMTNSLYEKKNILSTIVNPSYMRKPH